MRSARDLFEHELREMYDRAKRLIDVLDPMRKKVSHPDVWKQLGDLRTTTEEEVRRLEQIFDLMGSEKTRSENKPMEAFVESFSSFVWEETPEKEALDLEATEIVSDIAEYLMAGWETMLLLAERSGVSSASPAIGDFLHLGQKEDKKLSKKIGKLQEPLIESLPPS